MGLYESSLTIPEEIEGDETMYERWPWPGYEDPGGLDWSVTLTPLSMARL